MAIDPQTAIAAFGSTDQAERAVCELIHAGFPGACIGLAAPGDDLEKAGLSEPEAQYYEEATQEGRTLVFVQAGDRYADAMAVFTLCGGTYVSPVTLD